jgi:hypothetical protein
VNTGGQSCAILRLNNQERTGTAVVAIIIKWLRCSQLDQNVGNVVYLDFFGWVDSQSV